MPSEDFKQFKARWETVKEKYVTENGEESFTLEGLRQHLVELDLLSNQASQTSFNSIENKFLQYLNSNEQPETVNLPNSIFKAIDSYLNVKKTINIKDLVKEKIKESRKGKAANTLEDAREIGFLGRGNELTELGSFLQSSESHIFALYGVPMIGKTKLVNHFLENNEVAKTYKIIIVKLNPKPDNTEQRIKDEIFGDKEFNDFSDFCSNTLIVIQNFEEALKWTGNLRELHDIKDEYANIKTFLEKAAEISSIKLILESRFQIQFKVFLADWEKK